jgi:hypothetical protein
VTALVIASVVLIGAVGYAAWVAERDVVHAVIITCAATVLVAILAFAVALSFGAFASP